MAETAGSSSSGRQQWQQKTMSRRFLNKIVIITGSSSGIGREAAIEFAREGASVVIHGQSAEKLDETERLIRASGISAKRILKVLGSLEDEEVPIQIVEKTLERFGRIDVLVNNAGSTAKQGLADQMALENLDYLYRVNYRSVVQLSMLALPHLKETNGNVLNIGSLAGTRIGRYMFYATVKAALEHWTRGFAQLAAPNVRVNSLNPGPIDTPIFHRPEVTKEKLANYAKATLLGRLGKPSEMAAAMKFLCSDDASFIVGASLIADGGANVKFL